MKIHDIIKENLTPEYRKTLDQIRRRNPRLATTIQKYLMQGFDWDSAETEATRELRNGEGEKQRYTPKDSTIPSQYTYEPKVKSKTKGATDNKKDDSANDKDKESDIYDLSNNPISRKVADIKKRSPFLKGMRTGKDLSDKIDKFFKQ